MHRTSYERVGWQRDDDMTAASGSSGGSDPARSLALLWRPPAPPGARAGLSVDRIVAAAIELADADGLGALSMRRVAEKLGAGTMSLYTYVPAKAELIDCMVDTVYGEVADPAAEAGGWRARLEAVARASHALYLRHPWMLQAATGRPGLGPNAVAKYDAELRTVDGLGLDDVEMDSVVAMVASFVHGAAREAVEAARTAQRSGLTDEEWWRASEPFLARVFDPARHPLAARVGAAAGAAHNAASDPAHAFEFGLQRLLDGIEVLVKARA
jgi:AcrR family transcriptional regulator